jgi:glutamyl-tRNA reductase
LQRSGLPLEELQKYLFLLRDRDATNHLLRVSAGLESLVMGEGQILAQVKAVHASGEKAPGFGRHLNGLFKAAVTAGKRVRTETSIASGAVSVSSAAAELAQMKLPSGSFDGARVLIVGAGKMTRLLVKHLESKGCSSMTLVNRSLASAETLAAEFPEVDIEIKLSPSLLDCAAVADVIFTASSSDEPLLTAENMAPLPPATAAVGGVRRVFDIAVPRNVSRDVADLPGVAAYNVDDLKEVVDSNKEARMAAAEEAKLLLVQERIAFEAWRDSLETVPTIKKLRAKAESIRLAELEKASKSLGTEVLSKKQRKVLEELSRGITNKLLHGPMQALRTDGSDADSVSATLVNMHAITSMYALEEFSESAALLN